MAGRTSTDTVRSAFSVRTKTGSFVLSDTDFLRTMQELQEKIVQTSGSVRGSIPLSSTVKRLVRRGSGKADGQKPKMYGHVRRIPMCQLGTGQVPTLLTFCVILAYTGEMTTTNVTRSLRDPATYAGEFVCAFCGSGWPVCADINPETGEKFTHAETCQKYYDARPDDVERYAMHPECENRLLEEPNG